MGLGAAEGSAERDGEGEMVEALLSDLFAKSVFPNVKKHTAVREIKTTAQIMIMTVFFISDSLKLGVCASAYQIVF